MTVREAAKYARTSPDRIRDAIYGGKLLAFHVSRTVIVHENDVDAYIRSTPVEVKCPTT